MHENDVVPSSLHWKRRLGLLCGKLWPRAESRRVILIYHAVGSGSQSLAVRRFEEQLEWLQEHAKVESLTDLLKDHDTPGLRVAITFDDGYQCVSEIAAPLMDEKDFPGTVYLTTGEISEHAARPSRPELGHLADERFLTWHEVFELQKKGWSVGSHGVEHLDLTTLSRAEIEYQLSESKRRIEERIAEPCRHFCYTWGRHDTQGRAAVLSVGYETAVAAHHKTVDRYSSNAALPRLCVREDYTLEDFSAMLTGKWDYLFFYQKARRLLPF